MPSTLDHLVVGAGLRGMHRGLCALRGGNRVLVVDRDPNPGGGTRTRRIEGYVCELGDVARPAATWDELTAPLHRPPPSVPLNAGARRGTILDQGVQQGEVEADLRAGAGGMEDLVTAFRRELGPALRLACRATAVRPADPGGGPGWEVAFGGAAPITASALSLCLPLDVAAALLGPLDPALAQVAQRLRREPRAMAFLGTSDDDAARSALQGYGVLVRDPGPARELLFLTNAFPKRAQPGKVLVRVELAGAAAEGADDAVAQAAEDELRRVTGWTGRVAFRRVHRHPVLVRDGAHAECAVRLRDLAARIGSLAWIG